MKKIISIMLCICMVSGMFSVMAFADEARNNALDRIDITVTYSEVYCDIPAIYCRIQFESSPSHICLYRQLEKKMDGEWSRDIYGEESIGTGTFRWKFALDQYAYEDEPVARVVPGTTQVFIDGADCGTVDGGFYAYSEPFEITEDDKCPEPVMIDEIRVEGFKEPEAGEAPVSFEDMTIDCACNDDSLIYKYFNIKEVDTKGNEEWNPEVIQKNRVYVYSFEVELNTNKYYFADSVKIYLNDEEYEMTVNNGNYAYIDLGYVMSRFDGKLGEWESDLIYVISAIRVISNRMSSFREYFWTGLFREFMQSIAKYLQYFINDADYLFAMDLLDVNYLFYSK